MIFSVRKSFVPTIFPCPFKQGLDRVPQLSVRSDRRQANGATGADALTSGRPRPLSWA